MEAINHQIIDQIIQRIDIGSDRQIFFNQQPYGYTQGQSVSVPMLAENLQNLIYSEFYIRPTHKPQQVPTPQEVQNFTNPLRKANQTQERFDEGWTVLSIDYQGIILAQKGSYKRNIQAGEYIGESCFGRKPQQGDTIKLYVRKDYFDSNGGFYFIFGDHQAENNPQQMVRFYFNIQPEGSAKLVEEISTKLNRYEVPFQFKCLNHEALYNRADSAVLYAEKRYSHLIIKILKQIHDSIKPFLKTDVPAFTLKITDGIGFAENPFNQAESFGTNLSKIIATGIINASNQQMPKTAWKQEILKQMKMRYLDINALYLNPNTKFPYQFSDFN